LLLRRPLRVRFAGPERRHPRSFPASSRHAAPGGPGSGRLAARGRPEDIPSSAEGAVCLCRHEIVGASGPDKATAIRAARGRQGSRAVCESRSDPYPIQFGSGDWITVITRATGTFTGKMALPNGRVIAPTGKAFDLDFSTTARWEGDELIAPQDLACSKGCGKFSMPSLRGLTRFQATGPLFTLPASGDIPR